MQCVACQSCRVQARHYARRVGSLVGGLAGATAAQAIDATPEGACHLASSADIPNAVAVGVPQQVLLGFIGAHIGSQIGAELGQQVDQSILNNYVCLDCGHTF